jgi:ABC-2 type transport system permease protein
MASFWLVAKHEYRRTVVRRGFLLLTLAIPVGLAALVGLGILVETAGRSKLPMGYVDQAGVLDVTQQASVPNAYDGIEVRGFPDEESALAALEREEIQAFFVFPADYRQTLDTDLYFLERPPGEDAWSEFNDFVRTHLVAGVPAEVQYRLLEGPRVGVLDTVSGREFSEDSIVNVILPFVASFLFFFATMSAAGYMLGVVANEKENRTMEIMVTSVTPGQLIGGKTLGLLAAALTQLAIYVVAVLIAVKVAAPSVVELQQITVPWEYLGIMALFFFPAYGLIAAIMVAIGSVVTELQQGQQLAGILNLFFMLPLFLLPLIFENPGHPAVVFFSIFPTSSFLTVSLRWGLGTVPVWQLGASWAVLVATAALMVWAAARIFRVGMLRYGQPLTFQSVLTAVRGN